MRFQCGCLVDAQNEEDYCNDHFCATCHCDHPLDDDEFVGECPVCWRRRLLSVNTDYATTRLARQRIADRRPGIDPALDVRLAEKDEFPDYLTANSKEFNT